MKSNKWLVSLILFALAAAPVLAQFKQQGSKLTVPGITELGQSVALSADGNTAIAGAPDSFHQGAAFAFTRHGNLWMQQGDKLIGSGGDQSSRQGTSVALSADGNTALVGGSGYGVNSGAVWVFTRTNGIWTQQGSKLVGSNGAVGSYQGAAVALSADGNTALIGGPGDKANVGAVWIFTRSGGVWTQQGGKLVATGAIGPIELGWSVALSADGNTALFGGFRDNPQGNSSDGAVWVFTRTGSAWTQQGNKLVGSGASGHAAQGTSVALSADGNTALVGGEGDNNFMGALWVFTRSGGIWTQQGSKLLGSGVSGIFPAQLGHSVALSADGNLAYRCL